MPGRWESTILLRVTDVAYVRSRSEDEERETQELVECPRCHRDTDWLIAAFGSRVDFACRCGNRWLVAVDLTQVVALAEAQPVTAHWQSFDDVRRDLGFRADAEPVADNGHKRKATRRPSLHGL